MRGRWLGALSVLALALAWVGAPGATADSTISLSVNGAAGNRAISPDIYGLNYAYENFARLSRAIAVPVNRWGGNETDTYNWRLGSSNTGSDYYYENISDCFQKPGPCRPGYQPFIERDRAGATQTLLTLPMMGWVAKNAPTKHPFTCGFPSSLYPSQDSFDPYDSGCGNGLHGGNPVQSGPSRDGIQVSDSLYTGWLRDLITRYGTAAHGGVSLYELGNEPSLWADTHRDMHPAPETANELWKDSMHLSTLIKAADPSAKVVGFSEWGWPGYFCSEADDFGNGCLPGSCTSGEDCGVHGDLPMAAWYLQQFRRFDESTHIRHLDYFDLHYYAQGGSTPDVTRSLWDPSYADPSWIAQPIDLIPRMRQWVNTYYPGTKLSLSEYNLSVGNDPRQNAVIQADALGIFAREGLDLATRWPLNNDGNLIGDAFRIYRDYDGHGGRFGDTWISSNSSDQAALAVYGARRARDGAITVLVLNKTTTAQRGRLNLNGFRAHWSADTWSFKEPGGIVHAPRTPITAGTVDASYPPMSMTLYVMPPRIPPATLTSPGSLVSASTEEIHGRVRIGVRNPNRLAVAGSLTLTTTQLSRHRETKVAADTLRAAPLSTVQVVLALSTGARTYLTKHHTLTVRARILFRAGGTVRMRTEPLVISR